MPTTNASCPLDLTPTTIAAWRDGALPADESARIAAHVPGCPACQREIVRLEALDETLRRQPVPTSDSSLWRDVRARMANHRGVHSHANRQTTRRIVGAASALAAVLLLALGFAQLFRLHGAVTGVHPGATATIQGTPTPLPTAIPASPAIPDKTITIQAANLPVQGVRFDDKSPDILTFGVAATDGATAYACYSTSDQTGSRIAIYRTSDRAIHWTRLAQFPVPRFQTSDCLVQVNTLDASSVLVNVMGTRYQDNQPEQWFELTEDGGASWAKILQSDANTSTMLYDPATADGRVYALYQQSVSGHPESSQSHLSVSTDHLRTWRALDTGLVGANQQVTHFWARPDGGLLVEVSTLMDNGLLGKTPVEQSLFTSRDGGAHWQPFAIPLPPGEALVVGTGFFPGFLVQIPTRNAPWRVCAGYAAPGNQRSYDGVVCTFNGGQTWSVRPTLCREAPCSTQSVGVASGDPIGTWTLTADNSLLTSSLAPSSESQVGLYRLPPDSSQWQYLGAASSFFYAPTAGGGVLWLYSGGTYLPHMSGSLGDHVAQAPKTLLATATYP